MTISLGPGLALRLGDPMGRVADMIRAKLSESHFHVAVVSAAFAGQSRVARQRLVYGLLAEELRSDIHALSLTTLTPEEDRN